MSTVTIGVLHRDAINARFLNALNGDVQDHFRGFETIEDLWQTLTPRRWVILNAITGLGPVSLCDIVRRVGCQVKIVHEDVAILVNAGLLNRRKDGAIEFPFDAVHVDFMLRPRI
jgi:predicted transcriptional regulator